MKLLLIILCIQACYAKELIVYKNNHMISVSSEKIELKENIQSILMPSSKYQGNDLLPENSTVVSVNQQQDDIVITLGLSKEFIHNNITEELLEKLSRIIDINLDQLSPQSKKIHFAVIVNGKQIALSHFLYTEKVPVKEAEYDAKLTQSNNKNNGSVNGPLSDKVLFISQAHGWIDYNSAIAWETQRGITHDIVEDFVNSEAINQYLLEYLHNAGAKVFTNSLAAEEWLHDGPKGSLSHLLAD